jgi:iron complex outermembrane recepter protein
MSKRLRLTSCSIIAFAASLVTGQALAAQAPTAPTQEETPQQLPPTAPDDEGGDIVVTGIRGSLLNSLQAKRNADQVVEAISAEDIGKLPDRNIGDALQRVTGVQLTRSFGEGSRINIRGLQAVRIEVDGRSTYGSFLESSPGDAAGRNAGLEQLSSDLFSKIEVFKTPVASQIEGGLGGVVNARTNKPFDFNQTTTVISAEGSYGTIAKEEGYSLTGLFTTRLFDDTLGVLVSGQYQNTPIGFQGTARTTWNEGPVGIDLNGDGRRDIRPNIIRSESFKVERKRLGVSGNVTYRPNDEFEMYSDITYSKLDTNRKTTFVATGIGGTTITNPVFDGNYIVSGNYNGRLESGYVSRVEPTNTLLMGTGAKYKSSAFSINGEIALSRSRFNQIQSVYSINTINPIASFYDERTADIPTVSFANPALLADLANYQFATSLRSFLTQETREKSARLDAELMVGGFLKSVKAGVRFADLKDDLNSFQTTGNDAGEPAYPSPTANPALFPLNRNDLFVGFNPNFPQNFVTIDPEAVASRDGRLYPNTPLRRQVGRPYVVAEKTYAGYLEANLEWQIGQVPVRGNVGVRVVQTKTVADSTQRRLVGGVVTETPRTDTAQYTDILPSANLAFELNDRLIFRVSAAKVLARQALGSLASNFLANTIPPITITGGNPALEPTRVTQYDATLEWYFAPASLLSGAVFYKDAKGFVSNVTRVAVVPGFEDLGSVIFSQPFNTSASTIKGFELSYQQPFDFLPGALNGLGFIGSFTYADGEDDTGNPIVGLSKTSYNTTLFYEKDGFDARVSYVWRSERLFGFFQGSTGPDGTGRRNTFVEPVGTLDAAASYDLSETVNIFVSAQNILFKKSATEYYNVVRTAQTRFDINERRFAIGARVRF